MHTLFNTKIKSSHEFESKKYTNMEETFELKISMKMWKIILLYMQYSIIKTYYLDLVILMFLSNT